LPRKGNVSRAVREALLLRPCMLEAVRYGVVNFSALARFLKGDIEENLGREVNVSSIKMALVRLSREEAQQRAVIEKKLTNVVAGSSITLVDDVVVITLWEKEALKYMSKFFEKAEKARFFQMTQGVGHVTLMLDAATCKELLEEVPRESIEAILKDQTAIIMTSPREIVDTPGVISYITTLLSSKGINITQIISCHTDSIFVVSKKDSIQAYLTLTELINKFRAKRVP